MGTVKLKIDGMHCGGCVRRVKAALEATPGVTVQEVSVGTAVIAVSQPTATADTVVTALGHAGYRATAEAAP